MTTRQILMLKAMAFVFATVGATGLLVAAGLAEEPEMSAANSCVFCLGDGGLVTSR
ncbi:hypothetical protein H6CHR_02834 [Variovorax sp. PBL-H6]|uniref:hypothetical protein n=1 Tax=Variovorax sp. PBL-H6 TaxID=434009 RepID=UPI0013163F74|nr:hypothetical protein [Variovorax sp. PBL-H6]VTU27634.1 hypothetical protein H6CHR_02834 [Variovorax sp. PBL-H6]